jgi:hypothetical protein
VQGRKNPAPEVAANQPWYGQTYTFYDAKGIEQPLKGDKLADVKNLGYTYDNCPPKADLPNSEEELIQFAMRQSGETPLSEDSDKIVASSNGPQVQLAIEPVTATIELSREAQEQIEAAALAKNQREFVVLQFENVEADKAPRAYYEVYINLPQGVRPDPDGRYYVGNLGMFGIGEPSMEIANHVMPSAHRNIDLIKAIRALMATGEWDRNKMSVTLVMPIKLDADEANNLIQARPRFSSMNIMLMVR